MRKNMRIIVCLLVTSLLDLSFTMAGESQFKLSLSGQDLVVSDAKGTPVSIVPLATIGRTIDISPVSFQVSFGRDVHDNFSAIISSNPDHPSALNFEIFGHKVSMDKSSLLTCTASKDSSQVAFDPGFLGQVKLDGKAITSMTALGGTPSMAPAAPLPNTISQPKAAPATPSPAPSTPTTPAKSNPTMATNSTPAASSAPTNTGLPTVELAADFRAQNPGVDLVSVGPAKEVTPQDISQMAAAGQIAQKQLYWAEPVTPPDASQAPVVASNEIKLAEVRGDVKVTNSQGKSLPAKDGTTIDSASTLTASDNSSVAVLIGGVDSVRLTPNTTASVTSSLTGDTRTTLVDLKEGTVFNKVGQREGEKQDYKVQSPSGVACARGTDYSTTYHDGRFVTMVAQGAVEVSDNNGKLVGTAAPTQQRTLAYIAVGGAPATPSQQSHDILQVLAVASQVNNKVNNLLAQEASGQTLSSAEQSYLMKVAVVELAVLPIPVNDPLLLTRQLPPPAQLQPVLSNIQGPTPSGPVAGGQPPFVVLGASVPDPNNPSASTVGTKPPVPRLNPPALMDP